MIKKFTLIFIVIFIVSILIIYNVETKNCTEQDVIKIAQEYIKNNNKEAFVSTITNFESPKVELLYIDRLVIYNSGKKNVIKNKECYKVTFNYPLEMFTSPYDVYINSKNGKCYGSTLKY